MRRLKRPLLTSSARDGDTCVALVVCTKRRLSKPALGDILAANLVLTNRLIRVGKAGSDISANVVIVKMTATQAVAQRLVPSVRVPRLTNFLSSERYHPITWLICGHGIILNWNCSCRRCCCCWIFSDVVFAERHVTLLPSHVAGGRVAPHPHRLAACWVPAVVVLPHHCVCVHLRRSLVPVLASSTRLRLAHSPHVCDSRALACR